MKNILILIMLIFLGLQVSAQQFFKWSAQLGSAYEDNVNSIVCPSNNKIYVTGTFVGEMICDNKKAEGIGKHDIFFASFNDDGKIDWIKSFGGLGADNATILALGDDCIFMAGSIYNNVELGNQKFEGEGEAIFVASWSLKGKINWLVRFDYSGIATTDVLEISPDGEILLGGMFTDELKGKDKVLSCPKGKMAYSITLSPNGECTHTEISSGGTKHRLISASYGQTGENYLLFSLEGQFAFGEDAQIYQNSDKSTGLLLMKRSNNNEVLWTRFIEDSGYSEGIGIVSNSNGITLCTNFDKTLTLDESLVHTDSRQAVALLNFNGDGDLIWSEVVQGSGRCRALDALSSKTGNTFITGYYTSDYNVGETYVTANNISGNIFLMQFNENGEVIWHNEPGDNAPSFSKSFTIDQTGNIILAAGFKGKLDLEGNTMESFGSTDILVAKYFNCNQLEVTIDDPIPLCQGGSTELKASGAFDNYLWNGTDWGKSIEASQPGLYYVYAYDNLGCAATDSVTLNYAEIPNLSLGEDIELEKGQKVQLKANEGFAMYTWDDSSTGRTREIEYKEGVESEVYSVVGETMEGCLATDSVTVFFNTNEKAYNDSFHSHFLVYPNPVDEILYWSLGLDSSTLIKVQLTGPNGNTVYEQELDYIPYSKQKVEMKALVSGSYLLTLNFWDIVLTRKVVKK